MTRLDRALAALLDLFPAPIAPDLWALPCPRALDHTPPGDWTLAFRREDGRITSVTVGCWLARRLHYERMD